MIMTIKQTKCTFYQELTEQRSCCEWNLELHKLVYP